MEQDKKYTGVNELSRCLDSLNEGKSPDIQDEEIKELLQVAVLVKQSINQNDLPKGLIDEMVEHLADELGAHTQKRRNYWLYGGLIGSVAAVLIATFVQFVLPQSSDMQNFQVIGNRDSGQLQKMVATTDQSSSNPNTVESTIPIITQGTTKPVTHTETTVPIPDEGKTIAPASKTIAEIIQGEKSTEIDQKPNQVAMLQQEESKDMTTGKYLLMAVPGDKSLRVSKKIQPEGRIMTMMVIPNQEVKSTIVDKTHGVIQQVYNLGNNDEIIITQRLSTESRVNISDDVIKSEVQAFAESAAIQPVTRNANNMMNSLTVKVDKYNITIEGNKTTKELQKIAESLVVKKIEQ
jgi:hypothetical protein